MSWTETWKEIDRPIEFSLDERDWRIWERRREQMHLSRPFLNDKWIWLRTPTFFLLKNVASNQIQVDHTASYWINASFVAFRTRIISCLTSTYRVCMCIITAALSLFASCIPKKKKQWKKKFKFISFNRSQPPSGWAFYIKHKLNAYQCTTHCSSQLKCRRNKRKEK